MTAMIRLGLDAQKDLAGTLGSEANENALIRVLAFGQELAQLSVGDVTDGSIRLPREIE